MQISSSTDNRRNNFIGSTAAKHRVPRAYPPLNPMQRLVPGQGKNGLLRG